MDYDVIIVGASFAGLTVASQLQGKVLVIDKKPIGVGQTSTCCTLEWVLKRINCLDTIVQSMSQFVIHTGPKAITYPLPSSFCTFDYAHLCKRLWDQSQASFLKAKVLGLQDDNRVLTDQGEVSGTYLIDCSGWRGVLASAIDPTFVQTTQLNYGIECEVPYQSDHIHFYLRPAGKKGEIIWVFPYGDQSRIGIGHYTGYAPVRSRLVDFLAEHGLSITRVHGGYFPYGFKSPVVGSVFVVGDAGGQCFPFTGEGIRNSVYFGLLCAAIVQRILHGEISLTEGLRTYQQVVQEYQRTFWLLHSLQRLLITLPEVWVRWLFEWGSHPRLFPLLWRAYETVVSDRWLPVPHSR